MNRAPAMMQTRFASNDFLKFLFTGGIAAAVNWGSRIIYNIWMPYSAAIVVAYVTGMITAFVLARLFVFKGSKQTAVRSALFFVLVNLVAVAQTWFVSVALAFHVLPMLRIQWHARDIAHLVGVGVPVFTSYVGHKRWSFKGH